ncbi:MAG TPA: copper chaperone PCu(A)C [Pseudolabrys sp.]|nr:copper chaperone PCu(A)C [Pseudolabrys sp.]
MLALMTSSGVAGGGVSIESAWIRFIIKARPAAGYFTLRNDSDSAVKLTGAASTACGMLMLHQSKQVDGVDKMLPVKGVAVPPHGTLTFAPGGYHLMCMEPQDAMKVGVDVPVTLKFAGGRTVTAQFAVRGPAGR